MAVNGYKNAKCENEFIHDKTVPNVARKIPTIFDELQLQELTDSYKDFTPSKNKWGSTKIFGYI